MKIYREPERKFSCSIRTLIVFFVALAGLVYIGIAFHATNALNDFLLSSSANLYDKYTSSDLSPNLRSELSSIMGSQHQQLQQQHAPSPLSPTFQEGVRKFLNPISDYHPKFTTTTDTTNAATATATTNDNPPNIIAKTNLKDIVRATNEQLKEAVKATKETQAKALTKEDQQTAPTNTAVEKVTNPTTNSNMLLNQNSQDKVTPLDPIPSTRRDELKELPPVTDLVKKESDVVTATTDKVKMTPVQIQVNLSPKPPVVVVESKMLRKRDSEVEQNNPALVMDEKKAMEILEEANKRRPVGDSPPIEDNNSQQLNPLDAKYDASKLDTSLESNNKAIIIESKDKNEAKTEKIVETSETSTTLLPPVVIEVQTCDEGNDPWVGQPVDSFKPPKGSNAVDSRRWKQAVEKMMTDLRGQKIGGAPLRAYITDQVNILEILRLELFCPYLSPKK